MTLQDRGEITRKKILEFLIEYKRTHDGESPVIREVQDAVALKTSSTVFYHLRRLQEQGLIKLMVHGYRITGGAWQYAPERSPNGSD